ncbi:MAG: hypothetical protein ACI9XJ_001273 [Marivirga sp.]
MEPNSDLLGFQFYSVAAGDEFIYAVEEINYRNTGAVDTIRYQIIDRILTEEEQGQTRFYSGFRYTKTAAGAESILSTLSITIDNYSVLRRLGNTKEVHFSFPVKEGLTWDGIPSLDLVDEYAYFKAFQPYTLNDSIFNQSVQVIEEDNQDSLTALDKRVSVYAANLGPIYRLSSQIEFCTLSECFGLKKIEIGKTVRMRRIFN